MKSPCHTYYYSFHGLTIAVTGDAAMLAALHTRLRHFPANGPGLADLRFEFHRVPDNGEHAITKPPGQARPVYNPPVGEVVYFDAEDRLYINYGDRVRVLCSPSQGHTRVSVLQSEVENLWLISHPMFIFPFLEVLKRQKRYGLHAAGLCIDGKGLLLPGTSGAGKSTLALALLRAGFGFLGDDMLFVNPGKDGLRVLAFPDEIDVTDHTVGLFPELHALLHRPKAPGWLKRQIQAEDFYGGDIVWECQPAVIVYPRVADATKSVLKPMDTEEALLELVPNIVLTEARSSQAHLDVLADLVSTRACYRLETGRDFDTLPLLLRDLIG